MAGSVNHSRPPVGAGLNQRALTPVLSSWRRLPPPPPTPGPLYAGAFNLSRFLRKGRDGPVKRERKKKENLHAPFHWNDLSGCLSVVRVRLTFVWFLSVTSLIFAQIVSTETPRSEVCQAGRLSKNDTGRVR